MASVAPSINAKNLERMKISFLLERRTGFNPATAGEWAN
jgi:hypothetical protein